MSFQSPWAVKPEEDWNDPVLCRVCVFVYMRTARGVKVILTARHTFALS